MFGVDLAAVGWALLALAWLCGQLLWCWWASRAIDALQHGMQGLRRELRDMDDDWWRVLGSIERQRAPAPAEAFPCIRPPPPGEP